MLFTRPLKMLAVAAGTGSVLLAVLSSTVQAERPTYRSVSHRTASHGHGYCPCPCPEEGGTAVDPDQVPTPSPEGGEDLPEIADLSGDTSFASAPQSAVPNAIGDSMAGCFSAFDSLSGYSVPVCPGISRFNISQNNSALPQCRVYYNYHYFDDALFVDVGAPNRLDVQRHVFGAEHAFWCDMASVGIEVPMNHTINSQYDGTNSLRDVEFGDVIVYLKSVLYQDCCKTVSTGLGVTLPTADDIVYDDGTSAYVFENDVVVLSPYLAVLMTDPCSNWFLHSFAQFDLPTDDYTVDANGTLGQLDGGTIFRADASLGYWISQDCCGNGIAAIAELHYATNIEGDAIIGTAGADNISNNDNEMLNATAGVNIANGCWDIRPAIVLPLFDRPDRAFDWEAKLQINRRF